MSGHRRVYADDDKYPVAKLALMRIPSLIIGLAMGFILSFVTSRFEEVLATNVQVVFFLPFIVYMADAVGTQTQTIYARDLGRGRAKFSNYLKKETALGLLLGSIFGLVSGLIVVWWLENILIGISVGFSMLLAVFTAPLVALVVTEIFQLEHQDPAVSTGPIATVIQDVLSVVIYGFVASFFLL